MFGNFFLRVGTYLVETFIGKGTIKDQGLKLESVKNAIQTRIDDVRKTTEIRNIEDTLTALAETDDKSLRIEKANAVFGQIKELNCPIAPPINDNSINVQRSLGNSLLSTISGTSFYKLALGGFLAVLLIAPGLIKYCIAKSELGRVFRSTVSTLSRNVGGMELYGVKVTFAKQEVQAVTKDLEGMRAEIGQISDEQLKKQLLDAIDQLEDTNKVLKNQISPAEVRTGDSQTEGWIYLGTSQIDLKTWEKAETISSVIKIQDLKQNASITISDSVNLRKEKDQCSRSSGDRIATIPAGETVTLLGDASICPTTKTVWVKVRRG